jgi:hypothetical protein
MTPSGRNVRPVHTTHRMSRLEALALLDWIWYLSWWMEETCPANSLNLKLNIYEEWTDGYHIRHHKIWLHNEELWMKKNMKMVTEAMQCHATNSTGNGPSGTASWSSVIEEIPLVLRSSSRLQVRSPVPILSHFNPFHISNLISWKSVLIFSHLRLDLSSGLLPLGFATKTVYSSRLSLWCKSDR